MTNRVVSFKRYLRDLYSKIKKVLVQFFSSSPWLSRVYYALFSTAFQDENWTVLQGMRMYWLEGNINDDVHYGLRRNIHRLEKALLMRPRKAVFAQDYIRETVEWYGECLDGEHASAPEELGWAQDVLEEYFSVVEPTDIVQKAKDIYYSLPTCRSASVKNIPYRYGQIDRSVERYETLLELARQRKSVRWYLDKPVPREDIDKAISLAVYSPSACNRQPFEYRILDDPALLRFVAAQVPGIHGFDKNLPGLVVIVGKLRAYFHERDRHLIYIDASLSAMAFMLALESLGISSCGINWPDQDKLHTMIRRVLNLQSDERVILLIAYGYADPDGLVAFSKKKNVRQMRKYNNEDLTE